MRHVFGIVILEFKRDAMVYHMINTKNAGLLSFTDFKDLDYIPLFLDSAFYKIVLCLEEATIYVDGAKRMLKKNEILFCKPLNTIQVVGRPTKLKAVAFNKDFYSLTDYDDEVSFYWFWFYGTEHPLTLKLTENEAKAYTKMYNYLERELEVNDTAKEDELINVLKRMHSISSLKIQNAHNQPVLLNTQLQTIKRFNDLMDQHFKKKNGTSTKNKFPFKSPRTITQLFKKHKVSNPSDVISEQLIQETKRILLRINRTSEKWNY